MDYTVDIAIRTSRPLTEEQLVEVASVGGVASGWPGGHELATTYTTAAMGVPAAVRKTFNLLGFVLHQEFHIRSIEVMTTEEQDRRLAQTGG